MEFFKPCDNPVNRNTIGRALIELAAVYDRQFKNKEDILYLATVWEEALASITDNEFLKATKFYIQTERTFPKPIDILETNRRLKVHKEVQLRSELQDQERKAKDRKFNQERLESARRQGLSDAEILELGISLEEEPKDLAIIEGRRVFNANVRP